MFLSLSNNATLLQISKRVFRTKEKLLDLNGISKFKTRINYILSLNKESIKGIKGVRTIENGYNAMLEVTTLA
ncbi:hypothetical protein Fmac_027413 [Flemingia macrophylla]|uniref:Ribosomal protein L20 n=1 Tax=Flemingia macrophylla TaxID=520843 RepID=A0ABD1LHP5_9FABA